MKTFLTKAFLAKPASIYIKERRVNLKQRCLHQERLPLKDNMRSFLTRILALPVSIYSRDKISLDSTILYLIITLTKWKKQLCGRQHNKSFNNLCSSCMHKEAFKFMRVYYLDWAFQGQSSTLGCEYS